MRLFLSYSRDQRANIEALESDLRAVDHQPFFDEQLTGGKAWWDQLLDKIEECDAFLPVLSASYLQSIPCRLEAEYARALGKPFLPVALEQVSPALCSDYIAEAHWVNYSPTEKSSIFELLRGLKNLPECPPPPEPRPERPRVPISYLTDLKSKIESPDQLTRTADPCPVGSQRPPQRPG